MQLRLGTAYLPGRIYMQTLIAYEQADICGGTPWQKQTLRNRTFILSPNGVQRLVVPVMHSGGLPLTDGAVKVDYSLPWVREHKGALEAAYNTSPFFEFFRDELFHIYDSQPELLFDLNFRIVQLMLKKMKSGTQIQSLPEFAASLDELSLVNRKTFPDDVQLQEYIQVFSYKYGFTGGLSMLDQMANKM